MDENLLTWYMYTFSLPPPSLSLFLPLSLSLSLSLSVIFSLKRDKSVTNGLHSGNGHSAKTEFWKSAFWETKLKESRLTRCWTPRRGCNSKYSPWGCLTNNKENASALSLSMRLAGSANRTPKMSSSQCFKHAGVATLLSGRTSVGRSLCLLATC